MKSPDYVEGFVDALEFVVAKFKETKIAIIINEGEPKKGMSSMAIEMKDMIDKDYAKSVKEDRGKF